MDTQSDGRAKTRGLVEKLKNKQKKKEYLRFPHLPHVISHISPPILLKTRSLLSLLSLNSRMPGRVEEEIARKSPID